MSVRFINKIAVTGLPDQLWQAIVAGAAGDFVVNLRRLLQKQEKILQKAKEFRCQDWHPYLPDKQLLKLAWLLQSEQANCCQDFLFLIFVLEQRTMLSKVFLQNGIGKTTLVSKVCKRLSENGIHVQGFVTEEVTRNDKRIGFDIVSFSGERGILARIEDMIMGPPSKFLVGRYGINIDDFEKISLPVIQRILVAPHPRVLVIDEVGKMELFSKKFEESVQQVLWSSNLSNVVTIITIPVKTRQGVPFLNSIRNDRNIELITVTKDNRNSLEEELFLKICNCFDNKTLKSQLRTQV